MFTPIEKLSLKIPVKKLSDGAMNRLSGGWGSCGGGGGGVKIQQYG